MNSITLKFIMIVEPAHTPINYQILFDSVPDCYLILTKTFTIVEVSGGCKSLTQICYLFIPFKISAGLSNFKQLLGLLFNSFSTLSSIS